MEVVLGVSMTPAAVRMVLVEGEHADGVTLDHDTVAVPPGTDATTLAAQVVSAIVGTRESATEAAHRLVSVGVVWSDHVAAARLRDTLRVHCIDDVALVSELHAAGVLAQVVGQRNGFARTALVLLEERVATLAVIRTSDGAAVSVSSRNLLGADAAAELGGMIARLEAAPEPPQAVFMVGTGTDIAALRDEIAGCTALPVHAPEVADLALARGAALAAARAPRFEAPTVGLDSGGEAFTSAESTQMAAAGYTAPSAYSAVADIADRIGYADMPDDGPDAVEEPAAEEPKPFLLVGSALASIFVVGVIALMISLAVTVRPTVDQRPDPGRSATAPSNPDAAGPTPPETIQAPVPVVQKVPRSVVVAPAAPAAPLLPAAPPPPPAADPVPAPAAQPAVPAAPVAPVAPAPPAALPFPVLPPIVITPIWPPLLPPAPVAPRQLPPGPPSPVTSAPVTSAPVTSTPVTSTPGTASPVTSSPQTSNPTAPVTTTLTTAAPTVTPPAPSVTTEPAPAAASPSATSSPPAEPTVTATTTTP